LQEWDLGHVDGDTAGFASRPEHASCNSAKREFAIVEKAILESGASVQAISYLAPEYDWESGLTVNRVHAAA
jgi:hypothetical protein